MDIHELLNISDRHQLETLGKTLPPAQIIQLIELHEVLGFDNWKLASILLGMPIDLFSQLILLASGPQLSLLKLEVFSVPIQFQLTNLAHLLGAQIDGVFLEIEDLEKRIQNLPLNEINTADLLPLEKDIENLLEANKTMQSIIQKALKLVWNTDRIDLIELLSHSKERCYKSKLLLGISSIEGDHPTGLFQQLENKLRSVYGLQGEPEALLDSDPAIEGLRRIGIKYLADYVEVGLVPMKKYEDRELMSEVVKKLDGMGLFSVKNLKQAAIFSKKSLREFISTRQALC